MHEAPAASVAPQSLLTPNWLSSGAPTLSPVRSSVPGLNTSATNDAEVWPFTTGPKSSE